jgi:GTP 3',8-cyclase
MPPEIFNSSYKYIPDDEFLTFNEIYHVSKICVSLGVERIRITGGEPLLRAGLEDLIGKLSSIPDLKDLSMVTNGRLLRGKLRKLRDAGLHRVTIGLDTLDYLSFRKTSGIKISTNNILASINEMLDVGFTPVEINTVIIRGINESSLIEMIKSLSSENIKLRFIEYMDVGNCNKWDVNQVVPFNEMIDVVKKHFNLEKLGKRYDSEIPVRFLNTDTNGEIDFIGSITQPFCDSCTRIRMAADGTLYTCLFAENGFDIKQLLRSSDLNSDEQIIESLRSLWQQRNDQYSKTRTVRDGVLTKVEMSRVGG